MAWVNDGSDGCGIVRGQTKLDKTIVFLILFVNICFFYKVDPEFRSKNKNKNKINSLTWQLGRELSSIKQTLGSRFCTIMTEKFHFVDDQVPRRKPKAAVGPPVVY